MKTLFVFLIILCSVSARSQEQSTGLLQGIISNATTHAPIHGGRVTVHATKLGANSSRDGRFSVKRIPAGVYSLLVSCVGYETKTVSDVVVKPGRTTELTILLTEKAVQADSVVVTAGYFATTEQTVSSVTLSYEEIRRAPGSGGDISRVLAGMPSVAKVNDSKNSLIVRGGSPTENIFYINNIAVPNINHFPSQGSSGGPIGILNVDLLRSVRFSAGGFAPTFGNALSSVMEIDFRRGSTDATNLQLDLNFAGYGVVAEGPLVSDKASWILSARRSYLDLLVKAFSTGTSVAPRYGDVQGFVSYQPDNNNTLEALLVLSEDESVSDSVNARENEQQYYGNQYSLQATAGVNWKYIWENGYSNTSLGFISTTFKDDYYEQGSALQLVHNRSTERQLSLRSIHTYAGWKNTSIEFGGEWQFLFPRYDNAYPNLRTLKGTITAGPTFHSQLSEHALALFTNATSTLSEQLSVQYGVRADYFTMNNKVAVQPRVAITYKPTEITSITLSGGEYAQRLSAIQLTSNQSAATFPFMKATHAIASIKTLLDDDIQLSVESYYKHYTSAPTDTAYPSIFIADESVFGNDFPQPHESMQANGIARSYGVELTLQKKLRNGLYGLLGASYWRSEYKSLQQQWTPRSYDNRFAVSIECGYKLSETWEISARWMYAGGAPYTPFNIAQSEAARTGVLDMNNVNTIRLPDYHSLNLRTDKRFNFAASSIVVYLSCWNVYNRSNVASVYWNAFKNQQGTQLQFGVLPIFGIEWEL
ncbi:MAG: TonB-dependent receptor [Candidatus Kapabacteria bacterium]|nr:TonB-dependent receptor [Candidatus Kapabacteria bacterium]